MKCEWPTCRQEAIKGNLCYMHSRVYGQPTPKKTPVPIPKKSAKMKVEDREYKKFKDTFLNNPDNKLCAIQGPDCTIVAQCINHRKRRFKDTKMNPEYVEPSCYNCNTWIEANDAIARETGHLVSKFI